MDFGNLRLITSSKNHQLEITAAQVSTQNIINFLTGGLGTTINLQEFDLVA
jgi:hypothetical protein